MDKIRERPLFTRYFDTPDKFLPAPNSVYIYGVFEQRSTHIEGWRDRSPDVRFVRLEELETPLVKTDVKELGEQISLRQRDHLEKLFDKIGRERVYVDITGISHHVWAPLVRCSVERGQKVSVVYVEPQEYTYSKTPMRGEIFDLSEKIHGISPIPLFVTLAVPDKFCFIPLLGFEGTRFRYMMEQVDPGGDVVPVVGVPGFRPEYPFFAFQGNEPTLIETRAWPKVHFARANCPFSLFYTLEDILKDYPGEYVKIAPIGTKPHALGAVLRCLTGDRPIELVYDHPKRKPERTKGAQHCLVYNISNFLSTHPLRKNAP